jgi:hypothetical protein
LPTSSSTTCVFRFRAIARSGATVTRLLCDPLPYKKYQAVIMQSFELKISCSFRTYINCAGVDFFFFGEEKPKNSYRPTSIQTTVLLSCWTVANGLLDRYKFLDVRHANILSLASRPSPPPP